MKFFPEDLYFRIARKLTRDVRSGEVTASQVACVADGTAGGYSHPMNQLINAELRAHKIIPPSEHEIHERAIVIAQKRAEEMPCMGGA